ncbi:hypothetical protein HY990_02485 [Candidatus Micrarchaeota archaeon]|nr:hypothetical protein [Candidatus Micrarchaeota archaeon]
MSGPTFQLLKRDSINAVRIGREGEGKAAKLAISRPMMGDWGEDPLGERLIVIARAGERFEIRGDPLLRTVMMDGVGTFEGRDSATFRIDTEEGNRRRSWKSEDWTAGSHGYDPARRIGTRVVRIFEGPEVRGVVRIQTERFDIKAPLSEGPVYEIRSGEMRWAIYISKLPAPETKGEVEIAIGDSGWCGAMNLPMKVGEEKTWRGITISITGLVTPEDHICATIIEKTPRH